MGKTIVQTPSSIQLYSGFRYAEGRSDSADSGESGVLRAAITFGDVARELSSFHSEAIDRGDLWREWETKIDPLARVDWQLLSNLEKLGSWLRGNHLSRSTAHALIGKYVYLRYLKDRGILSELKFQEWGIDPGTVFGRSATLRGFRDLNRRLDEWLNGSVFPIEFGGDRAPGLDHLQRVAGTFHGDDPISGQLHLDFRAYDFSHIPIETLSVIYEQFLHAEGRAKDTGAYYTPLPLVDFMLQELDDRRPLGPGMRVFDPACGSGAFLVQCYRRLIEQQIIQSSGKTPRPGALRDLLIEHVFGMDRDEDACRVAEMSLVLTLLDYINPPDLRRNPTFKIPPLHNSNIFHCDFFAKTSPLHAEDDSVRFDWIVGNPPWKELTGCRPGDPDWDAFQWMQQNNEEHSTGGHQMAEAFAWEVTKYLAPKGCVGLLLPAMTLFKYESTRFRQAFFSTVNVWCIANFANLTEVLFAGRSRVPAAAFFLSAEMSGDGIELEAGDTLVFSPLVANQEANRPARLNRRKDTWNIVVNASEIQAVPRDQAVQGDQLTWKVAMWGSSRDFRLLRSLKKRFPSLGAIAQGKSIHIHEGPQLRPEGTPGAVFAEELANRNIILIDRLRKAGRIYSFPPEAIGTLDRNQAYLRSEGRRSGIPVCKPPHVIVDAARRFAVFSNDFLVVPPRQIGIAGQPEQEPLLKALSLFLVSEYATYFQFFASPGWGVKWERATLRALKQMPTPLGELSGRELTRWVGLQEELVAASMPTDLFNNAKPLSQNVTTLERELNELTYDALGLDQTERWLIEDLVHVRMKLDEGKLAEPAATKPSDGDFEAYASALKSELDSFLRSEPTLHDILIVHDDQSVTVQVKVTSGGGSAKAIRVERADDATARAFGRARELVRRKHSQWLYFDRDLLLFDGPLTYLFKPLQRVHWTRSQALDDADQIIAETLVSQGG